MIYLNENVEVRISIVNDASFIDNRNKELIEARQTLYNQEEILRSIRSNGKFVRIIFYPLQLPGLTVLIWATIFVIKFRISVDFNFQSIIETIICFVVVIYVWQHILRSLYVGYKWRKGISDQEIIDNLLQQGKVVEGEIMKITTNNLYFSYHNGGKFTGSKKTSSFITNHWDKFQVGDKVAVLYAYNMADCLL